LKCRSKHISCYRHHVRQLACGYSQLSSHHHEHHVAHCMNQRHQKHSCTRTHFAGTAPCHPTTSHTHRHTACAGSYVTNRFHSNTHTPQRSDKSIMRIAKQTNKQKREQTDERTWTTAKRDPQTTRCSPSSAGSAIVPQHLPFLAWKSMVELITDSQ
jgi:hypothetical protein